MGCGNSKLVHDGSSEILPSKLGPLLRNQLENMRRRRRVADAMTLKESTLSTKELLKDTAAPDSFEDTSSKPDCEDEDDRNSLCSPPAANDCKLLGEKKGGRGTQTEEISMKSKVDGEKERQRLREEKVIAAVTAAIEQVSAEEEIEEAKKGDHNNIEDEDNNDDSEMRVLGKSLLHHDYIFPGSPSFRVYCTASISADSDNDTDEGRDVDDAPKTTSKTEDSGDILESINSNEDQESVTDDNNKSTASKGKLAKRMRKVFGRKGSGAMKSLLNVKSCYHPSCSGHDRTRLLSEKTADS